MNETAPNPETLNTVLAGLQREGGSFGLHVTDAGEWTCWVHFGRESSESPMAAGAAYGCGPSPAAALEEAARETGWPTEGAEKESLPATKDRRGTAHAGCGLAPGDGGPAHGLN